MSDPLPGSPPLRSPFFRPLTFAVGIALGLAVCSLVARRVSHESYHPGFTRFHLRISPEAQYYPTLDEMRGIVRSMCRTDQTLVIVGGNSIFNGVGQPDGKVWTGALQSNLGDNFVVVNLAFRGALCTDGGAVVAEALRTEYPHLIYVANTSPFGSLAPFGTEPYRYVFWEARSRGVLEDFKPRDEALATFARTQQTMGERFDIWSRATLDRFLRFRDIWNYIGFNYFFTIPNPTTPHLPEATWARGRLPDIEADFDAFPFENRFRPEIRTAELKIVRGFSWSFYDADANGDWHVKAKALADYDGAVEAAFPDDLKPRTLIMLSRNCRLYLDQLTPSELARDDNAYRDCEALWQKHGYSCAEYGRDYSATDFGDRTHLTAEGGVKLAADVANRVQTLAAKLGYTTPQP